MNKISIGQKKRFLKRLFVLVLLLALPLSIFSKIRCFLLKPPGIILPGIKKIFVLGFKAQNLVDPSKQEQIDFYKQLERLFLDELKKKLDGDNQVESVDYGQMYNDYLVKELIKSDRGFTEVYRKSTSGVTLLNGTYTNIFQVIDSATIYEMANQDEFGRMDEQRRVREIAKKLGAQAILVGTLIYSHQDQKEKVEVESDDNTSNNDSQTKNKEEIKIVKRSVNISIRAKLISVGDQQVLNSMQSQYTNDETPDIVTDQLPSVGEMVDAGLRQLSTDIANKLTPYYEQANLKLAKNKNKKYKQVIKEAVKLAEDLKIHEAYKLYKEVYVKDPKNHPVIYNLGVLNEVVGNYQAAKEWYTTALGIKETRTYKKAIKRIEKRLEDLRQLARIGINIQEHNFDAGT
jgi:tetratricopeptide (TPR) repeat protein